MRTWYADSSTTGSPASSTSDNPEQPTGHPRGMSQPCRHNRQGFPRVFPSRRKVPAGAETWTQTGTRFSLLFQRKRRSAGFADTSRTDAGRSFNPQVPGSSPGRPTSSGPEKASCPGCSMRRKCPRSVQEVSNETGTCGDGPLPPGSTTATSPRNHHYPTRRGTGRNWPEQSLLDS